MCWVSPSFGVPKNFQISPFLLVQLIAEDQRQDPHFFADGCREFERWISQFLLSFGDVLIKIVCRASHLVRLVSIFECFSCSESTICYMRLGKWQDRSFCSFTDLIGICSCISLKLCPDLIENGWQIHLKFDTGLVGKSSHVWSITFRRDIIGTDLALPETDTIDNRWLLHGIYNLSRIFFLSLEDCGIYLVFPLQAVSAIWLLSSCGNKVSWAVEIWQSILLLCRLV